MNVYFDTEFLEQGPRHPVSLISIGLVNDNGDEYYAIDTGAPWHEIREHKWLMQNVVPYLPVSFDARGAFMFDQEHEQGPALKNREQIAWEVLEFLRKGIEVPEGEKWNPDERRLEIWADCGGYDRVILGQLWGVMSNFPSWLPYWQHDLRSIMVWEGLTWPDLRLPENREIEHHALGDARQLRQQVNSVKAAVLTKRAEG
jgi:hypothetical protein